MSRSRERSRTEKMQAAAATPQPGSKPKKPPKGRQGAAAALQLVRPEPDSVTLAELDGQWDRICEADDTGQGLVKAEEESLPELRSPAIDGNDPLNLAWEEENDPAHDEYSQSGAGGCDSNVFYFSGTYAGAESSMPAPAGAMTIPRRSEAGRNPAWAPSTGPSAVLLPSPALSEWKVRAAPVVGMGAHTAPLIRRLDDDGLLPPLRGAERGSSDVLGTYGEASRRLALAKQPPMLVSETAVRGRGLRGKTTLTATGSIRVLADVLQDIERGRAENAAQSDSAHGPKRFIGSERRALARLLHAEERLREANESLAHKKAVLEDVEKVTVTEEKHFRVERQGCLEEIEELRRQLEAQQQSHVAARAAQEERFAEERSLVELYLTELMDESVGVQCILREKAQMQRAAEAARDTYFATRREYAATISSLVLALDTDAALASEAMAQELQQAATSLLATVERQRVSRQQQTLREGEALFQWLVLLEKETAALYQRQQEIRAEEDRYKLQIELESSREALLAAETKKVNEEIVTLLDALKEAERLVTRYVSTGVGSGVANGAGPLALAPARDGASTGDSRSVPQHLPRIQSLSAAQQLACGHATNHVTTQVIDEPDRRANEENPCETLQKHMELTSSRLRDKQVQLHHLSQEVITRRAEARQAYEVRYRQLTGVPSEAAGESAAPRGPEAMITDAPLNETAAAIVESAITEESLMCNLRLAVIAAVTDVMRIAKAAGGPPAGDSPQRRSGSFPLNPSDPVERRSVRRFVARQVRKFFGDLYPRVLPSGNLLKEFQATLSSPGGCSAHPFAQQSRTSCL